MRAWRSKDAIEVDLPEDPPYQSGSPGNQAGGIPDFLMNLGLP